MSQTSTVLIVDDESIGRETLEGLLSQQGYQLVFASNGPEALSQAAEVNPDVILLDIMMPGMDGFEVCQQIRADAFLSEVPIIMVTALDDRASRLRGLEVGADDFISKPFDRVELRTRVRTITHLNRYRRLLLEQEKFVWVVEQAPEAYLVLDNEDQIIYANAKARLYLNLPTDLQEPIYDTFLTLAKQIYRCEPQAAWEQWLNNNFSQLRYLVRPETQTAKAFWLQVDVMRMSSQLVREYLIRLRDITDKMLNERLKWSFQGQVNHKLRSSLHPILGMLEYLKINHIKVSDANRYDCLDMAHRGALRLETVVEDILQYLNLEEIHRQGLARCSIAELMTLIAQYQDEFDIDNVALSSDIEDNKASEIKIVLSSQAIELILKELFENSKKFHPEESPQIHIELTLFANRLRLRFSDNGVSLSPQQLAQMWLPYYQGEKYFTGEVAGVGLGLAMVASLVWEVGGQCRGYNRTQGHGIVIELMIPLPQYEF